MARENKFRCTKKGKRKISCFRFGNELVRVDRHFSVCYDTTLAETVNSGICTSASYSFDVLYRLFAGREREESKTGERGKK